jgi:hypothetical protein
MIDHDTFVMRAVRRGWVLLLNGETVGTFDSQAETERAAFAGLEVARQSNKTAQVFRQETDGQITLVSRVGAGLTRGVRWGPDSDASA